MSLSKKEADALLRADVSNIAKKLKDGKTLTAQERAWLKDQSDSETTEEEPAESIKLSQVRLAQIYGVSNQTLNRWVKEPTFPNPLQPNAVFEWLMGRKNRPSKMNTLEQVSAMLSEEIGREIEAMDKKLDGADIADPIARAKYEKICAERDILLVRLDQMRGSIVTKATAVGWYQELVGLFFEGLELNDEEMAEAWEGHPAIKIMEGRKNERDRLRNEIENTMEKNTE